MRLTTGEQLREVAAALKQDQRNYLHEVEQGKARIAELEAELAALKAQEPIGWYTDDHLTDKSATTYDRAIAERWDEKGWQLWPLYANPVAQAELQALLEELSYRLGQQKIWDGMEWHYNPLPSLQYLPLIEKINAALAKKELSE